MTSNFLMVLKNVSFLPVYTVKIGVLFFLNLTYEVTNMKGFLNKLVFLRCFLRHSCGVNLIFLLPPEMKINTQRLICVNNYTFNALGITIRQFSQYKKIP